MPAAVPASERVLDVHTHAMPMPLLTWLAGQGLAEVQADRDVVRLAPEISGVGPGAPLPLARSQYDGLRRNALYAIGASRDRKALPIVKDLTKDPSPVVRDAAAWARDRLG